jgi:hypothetical protein
MVFLKKWTKRTILTDKDINKGPKWNLFSLRDQNETKKSLGICRLIKPILNYSFFDQNEKANFFSFITQISK